MRQATEMPRLRSRGTIPLRPLTQHTVTLCLTSLSVQHGPGSSVGIAPGYGLDGTGIESRWGGGGDFSHKSRPVLRPTQSPVQWVPGLSRG
jgi:hypothetical protein